MPGFIEFCSHITPLGETARDDLMSKLYMRDLLKGEYLLKTGRVCRQFNYIDQGLVKMFFYKEDKEFIMRFFSENSICTQFESYITQQPSNFNIIALEPGSITYIEYADFELLCKKHHSIETLFRNFASIATVNMMKRISEMLEENGTERYNHFVKDNNALLQRISLGDLASYLGITQVSVSRIRSRK